MRLTHNTVKKTRYDYVIKKITSRFFDELDSARRFIVGRTEGIESSAEKEAYSHILIYRLIFLYFIQKNSMAEGDLNFIENNFKNRRAEGLSFYKNFLIKLFFDSSSVIKNIAGNIFKKNDVEEKYASIDIADAAFENLFEAFSRYEWRLDENPLETENQLNLEVLGYIFEKYANQRPDGAYYTKEEVSGYIVRNTLIPALIKKLSDACGPGKDLFETAQKLISAGAADYLNTAMMKGFYEPYPKKIRAITPLLSAQKGLSLPAGSRFGETGETWRDVIKRRQVAAGAVGILKNSAAAYKSVATDRISRLNDVLTTYNMDSLKFLTCLIGAIDDFEILNRFLAELLRFRVIDIAVGSGSFLFSSLKILRPVYKAVKDAMDKAGEKGRAMKVILSAARREEKKLLENCAADFAILKIIAERNLFGTDIMPEALITARTRLALKLVSELDDRSLIHLASMAGFNITPGDSLAGCAYDKGDVIISNPPFMPVKNNALASGCGGGGIAGCKIDDIFAYFMVKSLQYGSEDCVYGFITPLSAAYGNNSASLSKLFGAGRKNWIASFDNIPSPLFAGVSQRVCFWISRPGGKPAGEYFTTPLYRWRSIYSKHLMNRIVYTPLPEFFDIAGRGVVRAEDELQMEFISKIGGFKEDVHTCARKKYSVDYTPLGYSHVARNFISAYIQAPPCYDSRSGLQADITRTANVRVKSAYAYAALAALNSEAFYFYWLSLSDGFNVSNGIITDFLKFLSCAPALLIERLDKIGRLLHQRRFEALFFKKNSRKFVGNFHCRKALPELCRRADLLVFMALGLGLSHFRSVFDYIQRIIALNVNSKNDDGIRPEVKERLYKPLPFDRNDMEKLFYEIDELCARYYKISASDIKTFCAQYQIK
ncbi:MAG TPA: hypothetical protein PK467_05435 [Candidatus Wallbacteria bacterium]|nr:hypothetical protein [Candidatus Wallbacteria bacterium]